MPMMLMKRGVADQLSRPVHTADYMVAHAQPRSAIMRRTPKWICARIIHRAEAIPGRAAVRVEWTYTSIVPYSEAFRNKAGLCNDGRVWKWPRVDFMVDVWPFTDPAKVDSRIPCKDAA